MGVGFQEQLRLELRIQLRRPFVWFCFLGFFALAFSDTVQAGWGGEGTFWINGAAIITNRAIILSITGVLAVAGIMCDPMARDRIYGVEEMILTTPADRATLGIARFSAAFLIVIATSMMFAPGIVLGSQMPGIPEELVGPQVWSHYAKGMAYFLIPNYFLLSALVFAVSARWQSRSIAFGAGIAAVALWRTAHASLGRDVLRQDVYTTYALLDPFGTIASWEFTMGRTVAQNNVLFTPLAGTLLYNRIIWVVATCLLIGVGLLAIPLRPRYAKLKRVKAEPTWLLRLFRRRPTLLAESSGPATPTIVDKPSRKFTALVHWELQSIWRMPATKICIAFLVVTLWRSASSVISYQFSLPSTDLLVHTTSYYFDKVLVLAVVWIAGELLWRDHALKVNELIDVQPVRDMLPFLAKTVTLVSIVLACWALSIVVNASYQAAHGYYRFEWWLYLVDSFIFKAPYYIWLGVLALTCQAVIRKRYVAMGVVLLVYASEVMLDALDLFHPMIRYGRVSHFYYSLMDGYGHFWKAHLWTSLYWTLAAILIWLIGWGSLPRGVNPPSPRWYWQRRLFGGSGLSALAIVFIGFVSVGSYIWYQSTVLAQWPPAKEDRIGAEIEREYKSLWQNTPQPRVVAIKGHLDLYPSERRFELEGEFTIENQGEAPIEELLITAKPELRVDEIDLGPGATLLAHDHILNIQHWRLAEPLPAGQRIQMKFHTSGRPPEGISVHALSDDIPEVSEVEVIGNGTSILNLRLMPGIGYSDRVESKPAWKRRRQGLPEEWTPPAGPLAERQGHALLHLGWVESVEMTISTDADQIVVHAGELVRQWKTPDGRNSFHYRIENPSRGWSSIASARYQTRTFERDGLPDVVVYFDPQHEPNVEFFAGAVHDAMAYFAERYGPPPFETFRLAEQALHYDGFGSRSGMGFSSEVLGWKTDIDSNQGEDIRRMAALMVALNWWGDQIIPANVAGAKVLHAGLPYWSMAMYLHQIRNTEKDRSLRLQAMREMFRGRSKMVDKEAPFIEEFKDSTLIQQKGSLLILYLAELMGTQKLEEIFAEFLEQNRFRLAPYPTAEEFLDFLRARVPTHYHQQIADIFEHKTAWRLAVRKVNCVPTDDGRWKLTATVDARKFYTSGWGEETEAELETPVPLVAFAGAGFDKSAILWQDLRRLNSGENQIEIELEERPTRFGIDPYLLLPDPNPYDNVRRVD